MLAVADMVAREVGEDTVVKEDAVGAVPFQSQRRRLDHHRLTAVVDHAAHRLLDLIAFGSGVVGLEDAVADQDAQRTDGAGLDARGLQNRADHRDGRGLALGTGDGDGLELLGGSAEVFDGHPRQRRARILDADGGDAVIGDPLVLDDQRLRAALDRVGNELVTVYIISLQRDEYTSGHDLAAVIDDVLDLNIKRAGVCDIVAFLHQF